MSSQATFVVADGAEILSRPKPACASRHHRFDITTSGSIGSNDEQRAAKAGDEAATDAVAVAAAPLVVDDVRAAKLLSAGAAASVSCALYNPLDCLRVRWQVAPRSDPAVAGGLLRYGSDIARREGLVEGLWRPGLAANVAGMCLSAAVRFGYYETVRDALGSSSTAAEGASVGGENKRGVHMIAAGMICGAMGYAWTTPFHLLKTMIQAEKGVLGPDGTYLSGARVGKKPYVTTFWSGAATLAKDNGILSLYRGTVPLSIRGALFTAGQMMGYDGLKTFARKRGIEDGPALHVISSVAASFGASFFSAPADLIMAKYMTDRGGRSLLACIKDIYSDRGIAGFWRGWSLFFIRLTPVMLTYSTLYEQFRLQLGIGYLT